MDKLPELTPEQELQAETREISSIIENGMEFKIGKRSFTFYEPYLGTLDRLAEVFIKMEYDPESIDTNPMQETKKMAAKYAKLCAKVIAIAVLNDKRKIKWLAGIYTRYFYWKLKPSVLIQLAEMINMISNPVDFTRSIVLMSANRTTMPNKVESKKA